MENMPDLEKTIHEREATKVVVMKTLASCDDTEGSYYERIASLVGFSSIQSFLPSL